MCRSYSMSCPYDLVVSAWGLEGSRFDIPLKILRESLVHNKFDITSGSKLQGPSQNIPRVVSKREVKKL
ncbi:hypothetical protein AVEN_121522-1, partial [Araneus ventricosus]